MGSAARLDFMKKNILIGMVLLSLFACARHVPVTRPEDALERVSWWRAAAPKDDREVSDIVVAVRQSLEYYRKLPPETLFSLGPDRASVLDMAVTLQNFLLIIENGSLTYEQKLKQIRKDFVLYRSVGSNGNGRILFTGYYEPILSCRTEADDVYQYPLYKRPSDIIEVDLAQFGNGFPKNKLFGRLDGKKVVPYFSREDIDQKNALAGKDLEILWCSDLIDIFVLQVQGSGKADLGDGKIVSILYDGQNGRPYKSIGKYLLDSGIIPKEDMSMQLTRQYLRDNPDKLVTVLDQNPSYVFFRLDTGPSLGNIGVPLTPGRSIATDSRLFPKGALAFISATKPVFENNAIKEWTPFTRFVVNQDTGGAIKGPGRADLFWGQGAEAELGAGHMQQEGELYFLMRKKVQ
jgi:membrane-bound lytic murein transglycosylase A